MHVNAGKQPITCLSLSVGMMSSWQVLADITFTIFARWFCVIGVNFLSFGVSSCLGQYAGMFLNPLILSILFRKKSAKSSADCSLVVPIGSGFSFFVSQQAV